MIMQYCDLGDRIIKPSIIYYCEGLFKSIANHPLFNTPFVKHPVTTESVSVSSYRFMEGIEIDQGLICSIYPSFSSQNEAPPSPGTISASCIYNDNFSLGNEEREIIYHILIKFTYKEVNIDSLNPSNDLMTKIKTYSADPKTINFSSKKSSTVNLYLNPSLSIISEYLELTRMVLLSSNWISRFFDCTNLDIRYLNYPSINWSKGKNSYFSEGHMLLAITSHIRVGWEDKFILPVMQFPINAHQP